MSDRRRAFAPDHAEHLGEARRTGDAYSPILTHANLDDAVLGLSQLGVRDGIKKEKDGIDLPSDDGTAPLYPGRPCIPTIDSVDTSGGENMVWADITLIRGDCTNNGSQLEVQVRRTDDPLESQFPIIKVTADLTVRFENLEPATTYEAIARAISHAGTASDWSDPFDFTSGVDTTPPATVTGVLATSGLRTVLVRWTDVADTDVINGNGTYEIQISTSNTFASILKTVRASGTVVSFTDLNPSTTYYVRVRGVDKSGNTSLAWSSSANTTTGQAATADIQTGAVTADLIAADAVITSKLAADSVTAAKLAAITMTVGKYIESTSYSSGSAGWRINANGNAEFNNVTVRGTVISDSFQTAPSGARIRMGSALTAADEIQFLPSSGSVGGSIRNANFTLGYAVSMRLSAGGIIDVYNNGFQDVVRPRGDLLQIDSTATTIGGTLAVTGTTNLNGNTFTNALYATAFQVSGGNFTVSAGGYVSAASGFDGTNLYINGQIIQIGSAGTGPGGSGRALYLA